MTLPFLRRALRASLLAAGCALLAGLAHAQGGAYPNRVVRVIVPFAASTSPDVVMRIVTPKVAELWGQQIIVENRTGAGGNIGAAAVANAAPDGYTLLYTINSTICANPHLYPSLPYDPFKSFAPVSLIANLGYVLIAKPGLPVRTLPELIAFAKANPGKLNYSSGGNGVGNAHRHGAPRRDGRHQDAARADAHQHRHRGDDRRDRPRHEPLHHRGAGGEGRQGRPLGVSLAKRTEHCRTAGDR